MYLARDIAKSSSLCCPPPKSLSIGNTFVMIYSQLFINLKLCSALTLNINGFWKLSIINFTVAPVMILYIVDL